MLVYSDKLVAGKKALDQTFQKKLLRQVEILVVWLVKRSHVTFQRPINLL